MKHYGAIVAGGGSRRYGRDKALETLEGRTFLEIASKLLLRQNIDTLVVLGRPDLPNGIADQYPGGGPAKNLASWINSLPMPSRVTVVPVDMPGLDAELLGRLIRAPSGAYYDDLYLPFSSPVSQTLPTNMVRMRDLLEALDLESCDWPAGKENLLKNINTPEDFSGFRQS